MPPWARASAAARWLVCPASTVLPTDPDSPGEAARWGTEVHDWKAQGGVPDGPEFSVLIRKRLLAVTGTEHGEALREEFWPAEEGTHELAMAMDAVTGRVEVFRGTSVQRDEWKLSRPDSCVTGSLDWDGELAGDPWTDDLKTGKTPDPPDSPQNRVYGAARRSRYLSITHWPRYPYQGRPHREMEGFPDRLREATFHDIQGAYRAHLEARGSLLLGEQPRAVTGAHCRWCPSQNHCPTYKEQA